VVVVRRDVTSSMIAAARFDGRAYPFWNTAPLAFSYG